MLRLITQDSQILEWSESSPTPIPENRVFLDLLNPTLGELSLVEKSLGHSLPKREEMEEIEESSRLYMEGEIIYLTTWVPVGVETAVPENTAISFILSSRSLAVVRHADPLAFRVLPDLIQKHCTPPLTSDAIFLLLMERILSRIADSLRTVEADLKKISRDIFSVDTAPSCTRRNPGDLDPVVRLLGRRNQFVANLRECLLSTSRVLQYFLSQATPWIKVELAAHFRSVVRDVKSLDDYANQQTQEMAFLLDSTLGLINLQQSRVMRILTRVCIMLLPPTLLATIYGMHFGPEIRLNPVAIALTLIAATLLPIAVLRWKKLV